MSAFNLKEAVVEALIALGGSGTSSEVREYIKSKFGRDWKNIGTVMDDLTVESESSFFPVEERVLRRAGEGKYALKEAAIQESSEKMAAEKEKPSSSQRAQYTLEKTIASYSERLKQVLNQPTYNFIQAIPKQIPAMPGVYLIRDDTSNQIIYAGRTKNLRARLFQQHLRGKAEGSLFRKALGKKINMNEETRISDYIENNCSFQILQVDSSEESIRLLHFMIAILAPTLNTKLEQ